MAAYIAGRPALGQVAALGSFYDARTDTFIPLSLFKNIPTADAITLTKNHSTIIKYAEANTFKDKLDFLGVKAELGASILAGLASVEGCGRFLSTSRNSSLVAEVSLSYSITTVDEKVNLTANGIGDCLAFRTLDTDVATHVVVGISWGAQCVVSARRQCAALNERNKITGELQASLGVFKQLDVNLKPGVDVDKESAGVSTDGSFEVTVHGDVLANDGLMPTDFETAQTFIRNLPKYIECANDGKGKPISYALMPLSLLSMFNLVDIKAEVVVHQLSVDCLEKFVKLFDDFRAAQERLYDYQARIQSHAAAIPPSHVKDVDDMLGKMRGWEATVKSDYAATLKDLRSGKAGDAQRLWKLLEVSSNGEVSVAAVESLMSFTDKMDFVDLIDREGAKYVGYDGPTLSTLLMVSPDDDAYVMYFNDDLRTSSDAWNETTAVILELLRDHSRDKLIVIVDADATGSSLENIYVSQLRNGRLIVQDVLEQRRILATNCVMRFNEKSVDRSVTAKPLQRRAVKIHCPQAYCDRTLRPGWICSVCHTIVEYGYVNDLLYCECGSCSFDEWEFKCNDPKHGSPWIKFESAVFKSYLDALEPFEELNILILGETGVGKSTWINAFINYLTFDTLDEAIVEEDLKWAIPCHFQTQVVNNGRFAQREVKVGSRRNEHDGSAGESATQQTSVYAVDIGKVRVRLIDTPGIGDTRGVDQDNKNMVDILRVLRSYKNLHGILILLKPNAPRLTVMFRFCIKQLLTHLHKNAADNIAFGFTNTRGSNFKPGDTFKPLEKLLNEYDDISMGLYEHNVYCFDSESFRYLAAQKSGIDMGYREDNSRSWENSVEECKRLVRHFQGIQPHQVRSTLNLNETRNVIIRLTEPMAILAQKMAVSIKVNEEQVKELQQTKLSRRELEKRLFVQKESCASVEVEQPRTVCTHAECVDFRSDFEGRDEVTIIYKTLCHRPCYLHNVTPRTKGDPQLQKCAAMDARGMCGCGHSWWDHMHSYVEYQPMTYKHRDDAVNSDLLANASNIQIKEEAIRMKKTAIEEYRLEHEHVQTTAIQFGFFLKRHAIMPYNDATLEYIDMLIDQEKMKLTVGGKVSHDALDALERYRAEHLEKVAVLKSAMERGDDNELLDDAGIRQAIDALFGLPNFGKELRAIFDTNERAADNIYREKSLNASAGSHWNRQTRQHRGNQRRSGGSGSQGNRRGGGGNGGGGEGGGGWASWLGVGGGGAAFAPQRQPYYHTGNGSVYTYGNSAAHHGATDQIPGAFPSSTGDDAWESRNDNSNNRYYHSTALPTRGLSGVSTTAGDASLAGHYEKADKKSLWSRAKAVVGYD
ncbi:hypothetical protein CONLIGDRAFT_718320 [Coniochaeta ligniaria NRRL 30616]|uniref:Uncharacterized protein n=1 Tax=Coniochaeta ligniaria NRRL 30616 TaxID=1408157 RepID=A0A1J7IDK4_9PEZI|nr:hypothetical protein CONLIGDRAFT_718320 [Coniochaeta ligniaria NRRL 30616]